MFNLDLEPIIFKFIYADPSLSIPISFSGPFLACQPDGIDLASAIKTASIPHCKLEIVSLYLEHQGKDKTDGQTEMNENVCVAFEK